MAFASLRPLMDGIPVALYTCDTNGLITYFNQAAANLWGCTPELGKSMWCGSWRIFQPDGTPLALKQSPMALALHEARAILGEEIIVERPDGTRRLVMSYPKPIKNRDGQLLGAINLLTLLPHTENSSEVDDSLECIGLLNASGLSLEVDSSSLEVPDDPTDSLVARLYWEAKSLARSKNLRDAVKNAAKGQITRLTTCHHSRSGRQIVLEFILKPVRCADVQGAGGNAAGRVMRIVPEIYSL
ncbi:MAG TPA: PAS domain-containing protein, partial [Phycisphaerae bacterium]